MVSAKGFYQTHLGRGGSLSIQENTCKRREHVSMENIITNTNNHDGRWEMGEMVVVVQILMLGWRVGKEEKHERNRRSMSL